MENVVSTIENAAEVAQKLITALYCSDPDAPTFQQAGLLDGRDTVIDYLNHGEWECGLHHLLYMIHESDIRFPRDQMLELHAMARKSSLKNHYSQENQVNLTDEQRANVFNLP
jgi:hypothetical protein